MNILRLVVCVPNSMSLLFLKLVSLPTQALSCSLVFIAWLKEHSTTQHDVLASAAYKLWSPYFCLTCIYFYASATFLDFSLLWAF